MLLALDTCGATGGVALGVRQPDEQEGCWFRPMTGRNYSELLLDTVSSLLGEAGAQLAQLKAVVVVSGPGSFTGIRIGVSAAKALAEAFTIPVITLSRLNLLARRSAVPGIPVLDAGRDEYYVRLAREDGVNEEVLLTRDQLLAIAADSRSPLIVCEERPMAALPDLLLVGAPTAVDALSAGREAFREGLFADVGSIEGNYVRRTGEEMLARIAKHAVERALAAGPGQNGD